MAFHHAHPEWVLILDYGSQYTQLIARRLRELEVYCEIHPFNVDLDLFEGNLPNGLILSGGPKSVNDEDAPYLNEAVFSWDIPILGVCYGMQSLAHRAIPGSVENSDKREFGRAKLHILDYKDLFHGLSDGSQIWMSHGDHVHQLSEDYEVIAKTSTVDFAAIRHKTKPIFGVQFHPEVVHTIEGKQLLENFAHRICNIQYRWTADSFIETQLEEIKALVGDKHVLCALSGGVDSTVVATLIHKAIGDQLLCIFVDNGLLRKNEFENVLSLYQNELHLPVKGVDASDTFLSRLEGVTDPEQKRKIIGNTFIDIFDQEVQDLEHFTFLAQGTLYPDVIESVSFKGPSATIKSHHNVGGLPEKMKLNLLEPVRELFKDEVRAVGRALGIPEKFITRHPFPGPGLGIRIISDITADKVRILQEADDIFIKALHEHDLYHETWQAFAALLPVQSVGVMGDERTYEYTVALRAVTSVDGMTADWAHLPYEFLAEVSNRIINQVRGINRVVYDISSKPPATIEWE